MAQAKRKNRVVRTLIPPPEMTQDIEDMLKASAVMKDADGVKHVKEQAALIYDRFHEVQAVAELEVSAAKEHFEQVKKELEALRRLQRTLPPVHSQPKHDDEENDDASMS